MPPVQVKPQRTDVWDELENLKERVRILEALTPGGIVPVSFGDLAKSIAGPDILRAWWPMGDPGTGEFEELSGWSGGPSPGVYEVGVTYSLTFGPGCLSAAQDQGSSTFAPYFVTSTSPSGQSYMQAAPDIYTVDDTSDQIDTFFSVSAWVTPTADTTDPTFRGAILKNHETISGTPDHEEGWALEVYWDGVNDPQARMIRAVNGIVIAAAQTIAPGVCSFIAGTYDGANLNLYVNGVLADSQPDSRTALFTHAVSAPTVGFITVPHGFAGPQQQFYYGEVNDIMFWAPAVLDALDWGELYAAGLA
jgi:Concanavalin A-like lectin/glucanases superfamily